jgi:hypothetical protein
LRVDEPVDLDWAVDGSGVQGWRSGWSSAVGEELVQVCGGEPGRHGFEPVAGAEQMDDGGVGPEGDRGAAVGGAEPELSPADG